MCRHAFLIMAHNNWYTLEKLIQIIDAPWNDIYLHVDSKSKDFCKEQFLTMPQKAVIHLTKRHNVTWGNESQITAEMELFKTAYANGPYHYYHFLSGQDLPLIDAKGLYDFFENKSCNYIQVENDVSPFEWRLQTYIKPFRAKWLGGRLKNRLNIWAEILQYKLGTNRLLWLKRKYPEIGKGHNWCDLTENAVKMIIKCRHDIRRFCRFTHCSDEMYKQIILLNSNENDVGVFAKQDIRYIDWGGQISHPKTLTINHYKTLMKYARHGYVFARKFDENIDREIIDKIANQLLTNCNVK